MLTLATTEPTTMQHQGLFLLFLGLFLGVSLATGCKKAEVITPTDIKVQRVAPVQSDLKTYDQTLTIDLTNGRATFKGSPDAEPYAHHIETRQLQQLRNAINGGTWKLRELNRVERKREGTLYTLTVSEGPDIHQSSQWIMPPQAQLPDSLTLLINVMDQSERRTQPLSESLNLLD